MILAKPIKKKSLQRMVYETLRQAIVEREIEPGEPINIKKYAEMLQVSAMPVREALRHLEAEGMVTFTSNRRIVVNRLSREELNDIYDLRIPLEELAVSRCFDHKNRNGLRQLETLHRQMSKNGVVGAKWFALNRSFHMLLHEMSGSSRLYRILQGLWNSTGPYLRIFSESETAVTRANEEHAMILRALRTGDRATAKRVLRKHLRNGLKAIEKQLQ